MRSGFCLCLLVVTLGSGTPSERRANFVHVEVTADRPVQFRAIWRPRAGTRESTRDETPRSAYEVLNARIPPDTLRRWRDPDARDTIVATTPADFVVSMVAGAAVFESLGGDALLVRAQLTPTRGAAATASGRALRVTADGRTVHAARLR